jgi:hypothetical protein
MIESDDPSDADGRSRDLAHDFQFRTLEQLTNLSLGGAGVTVTLIGGILKNVGPFVWIATVEFAIGAFAALVGQIDLTNMLLAGKKPERSRYYVMAAVFFLAMGVGSVSTSVFVSR